MKAEDAEKKEEPDMKEEDDLVDNEDAIKKLEESEEVQVRDIRYNLENLGLASK